ncbi:BatA domain-containing protein [Conexibacter sp. CPCC 206217]|uniref:BatA domain-containing protein n=1 Tax=Conexibacter sp. CPCC 206217 TaxID=3064574 RepID=UPI002724B68F|nr:BatA domain-containing protein [Conexibacter sp. CPCC 206217]MDO8210592.1 BatA domain-containing protein [Conexibacter sp. CPCC 206217]
MTLLTPWFLLGLVALAPLVALHLRRRRRQREVASLLLWRELPSTAAGRRRAALVLPLLLALQALIVVLIVVGLAQPRGGAGSSGREARPAQVFVLDEALSSGSGPSEALTAARAEIDRRLAQTASDTPVSVVVAGAAPRLLVAGASPRTARDAVASLTPAAALRADAPPSDLRAGLALAAGQLHAPGARVTLVHAAQDMPPRVRTDGVSYSAVAIGASGPAQTLEQPVGRCAPGEVGATAGAPPAPRCTVFAAIRNDARSRARARLVVERAGRPVASRTLSVAGQSRATISFDAAPGARLTLRVVAPGADDARATVTVPGVPEPASVTLVSSRPSTQPLSRALTSVPGVTLRLVSPTDYSDDDSAAADLVVFDRWAPDGALPDAPATLLVDPPRLPDGHVGAALADPELSGEDAADPLLAGVDLDGLAIATGGAHSITLPPALRAIAWAPGGPLIAAGQPAADRRIALFAFDPEASTLPQLPAFPILIANVVAWSLGELPDGATGSVTAGGAGPVAGSGGVGGAGGDAAGADDAVASDGSPTLVLRATDGGAAAPGRRPGWWPLLLAAALLVLLAEWAYPRWATRAEARA